MLRALALVALCTPIAAAGCSGADIDQAEFQKVRTVVIGCMKAPGQGVPDTDAAAYLRSQGGGDLATDAANALVAEAVRAGLEAWGEFEVVPADTAAGTGPYKALGTTARNYASYGGTYMLGADNGAVVGALFEDTGADAMLFIDWTWHVSAVKDLIDGRIQVSGVRYSVQLRLAMVKPDGTRIWFSRAKANGPDTDSVEGGIAFGRLAPELAKTLMDDAAAAMSSPD